MKSIRESLVIWFQISLKKLFWKLKSCRAMHAVRVRRDDSRNEWVGNWMRNFFSWIQEGQVKRTLLVKAALWIRMNLSLFMCLSTVLFENWFTVTKVIKYLLRFKIIMKLGTSFSSPFLVEKYFLKFTFYFFLTTPRKGNCGHTHVFVNILKF